MLIDIVVLTLIIETITIIGRYLFGSVKAFYRKNPLPVRVHHGYIGTGFLLSYIVLLQDIYAIIGGALVLSDVIHHLLLHLFFGESEFP